MRIIFYYIAKICVIFFTIALHDTCIYNEERQSTVEIIEKNAKKEENNNKELVEDTEKNKLDDNKNTEDKTGDDNENTEDKTGDDNKNTEDNTGDDNENTEDKIVDDNKNIEDKTGDDKIDNSNQSFITHFQPWDLSQPWGFDILVSDQIYIKIPLRKLSPKVKFFYGKGEFKMTKSDHARIPLFFFKDDKWLKNIFYNTILYSYNYTLSFNNIKLFHTKNINTPYDMAIYQACIYFPSVVSILQLFSLYNLIPKWLNILRLSYILLKPNTNKTTNTFWMIDIIELKFNNNPIPFFHTLHFKLFMHFHEKNESIINNMFVGINAKRNNVLHLKLTTSVLVNVVSMQVVFAKKLLWIIKGISICYSKKTGVIMAIHINFLNINFVNMLYPYANQDDNDKKFLQQNGEKKTKKLLK